MQNAGHLVGEELQKLDTKELKSLITNLNATYEFKRKFDSQTIHFTIQEFESEGKKG